MNLYLIIGRHMFHVYRKSANGFIPESIDGNSYYRYDLHNIKTSTQDLMRKLADINNLDDVSQLDFVVVENEDKIRNRSVEIALGNQLQQKIPIDDLIYRAISDLSKDLKKHIGDFGINYDGSSYLVCDGVFEKRFYSLLVLNIDHKFLLQFI